MFLATTALTEFWDTSDEILVLGPWCLRYDRRMEWEDLKYSILPNPWEDPRTVQDAERYCGRVVESLIEDLTVFFNQVHGVRYSQQYWRVILGAWLLYYVHSLYDRYISLTRALESYSELKTVVLDPSRYKTPVDTLDFVTLAYVESADLFNLQLYSQVLRASGFNTAIWREVHAASSQGDVGAAPGGDVRTAWTVKHLARKIVRKMVLALSRMIQPRVMLGEIGLNRRDLFRLLRAMAFRGWALPLPQTIRCGVRDANKAMRKTLGDIPAKDEFTAMLIQTLPSNLPLVYLEGYADFRKACLKMWPCPPAVMVSSADWYCGEAFKFLAAEFRERGSRLVGVQHGGGYGTSKVIPQERYECSIVDRWLSFGWGDGQENGVVRPLPHPRFPPLTTHNGRHGEILENVLLVTTHYSRYPYRFEECIGWFDKILEWRSRFIEALPAANRSRLIVRLNSEDFGWCQAQRLVDTCGPLRFDNGKMSFRQLIRQTRLVVIEYCGTAYLEALAANVPTILFWDPQHWEVRDEAAPYFEDLRKVGILWDSPEAAAVRVAEIYDEPSAWWQSETVQEVRRRFVERYALGREDWLDCWVKVLREEMALAREDGCSIV